MSPNIKSKDDLLHQNFLTYVNVLKAQNLIHKFQRTYEPTDAIKWYTLDSFIYRLVNRACRTLDIIVMFTTYKTLS